MGYEKAIEHGKEHRKPYQGAKAIDCSCRNHGGGKAYQCIYCLNNRMYQATKEKIRTDYQLKTYEDDMLYEELKADCELWDDIYLKKDN